MAAIENRKIGIVIVGHVDHGKSTLIGRLLHDTGSFLDGKFEEIKKSCMRRNVAFEWSFLLDAFQAERDQAITIDTTQIWFKTARRPYLIIDAPGHQEFLKNMISGAAVADAAILVVDATEGMREQTRRHAYLLRLMGLTQVVVAVNKMDAIGYDAGRFADVSQQISTYLAGIGLVSVAIVPIAARDGENLVGRSQNMDWYKGDTLVGVLDQLSVPTAPRDLPLRFPVQDVYRFDEKRYIAGRVESGTVRVGDSVLFSPSGRQAKVLTIEKWGSGLLETAGSGESIGLTLDQPIFVARGDTASHTDRAPWLTPVFRARIFWLGPKPLQEGKLYKIKLGTTEFMAGVEKIERVISTEDLSSIKTKSVAANDIAEVVFRSRDMAALDPYDENPLLGRIVIVEGHDVAGGGIISMEGYADQRPILMRGQENLHAVDHLLSASDRQIRNGHKGVVIWLTGLSGAGKSTLAMRVERALHLKGMLTYVLDGDNVRRGLNADLDFSPKARTENIRRVGEVAALMADAGLVCITAFISPYRADRAQARAAAQGAFHEIYIKADLATCEKRDPKGLYKKARRGEIADFTGVSSPYEPPETCELVVDTAINDIESCVAEIEDYIKKVTRLDLALRVVPS